MKSSCHFLFSHPGTSELNWTPSTTHSSSFLLQLRNSAHLYRCSTDTHHRKHMSRVRDPVSPLARWLDLQKTHHVNATYCCVTSLRTQKTLLKYRWPRVCCGRCLAMDLHVRVFNIFKNLWLTRKLSILVLFVHVETPFEQKWRK
jgi:hypothetical protein